MVTELLFQAALSATAVFAMIYLLRRQWRRRMQPNPDGPLKVKLPKPTAIERAKATVAEFDEVVDRTAPVSPGPRDVGTRPQPPAPARPRFAPANLVADLDKLKQAVRMLASASRDRLDRHEAALAALSEARQVPTTPITAEPQKHAESKQTKIAQDAISARLNALETVLARMNSEVTAFPAALEAITARLGTLEDTIARQRDRTVTAAMMPALSSRNADDIRSVPSEASESSREAPKPSGTDLWSDLMGMPDGMISLLPLTETSHGNRVQ